MCGACDKQERVCSAGHTQAKSHGDVFRGDILCNTCGQVTRIRTRLTPVCQIPACGCSGDAHA